MRVLFSHYLIDDASPPARVVQAIAQEMARLGHAVEIHRSHGPATAGAAGTISPAGARTTAAWWKGRVWFARALARNRTMARRDRAAIARFRPELIVVRHDAYCLSMAHEAHHAGIPLVTYADAPAAHELRRYYSHGTRWHPPGLAEALERRSLRASAGVTTVSRPAARMLAETYGLTMPVRAIPNGVHPDQFPAIDAAQRQEGRRALGITASHVVAFQGTFRPFHGVDRLQEMILTLRDRSDVHWLLLGDGPLRPDLEQALAGRVTATFAGHQPADRMGALLGLVDVLVVPHDFAPPGQFYLCPLKILEGAAAGCAVIASAQGDIPWLLDDGRAGILLDRPEIAAWAQAIASLLDDDSRRQALGVAARRHILDQFTWQRTAQRYADFLKELLDGRRPLTPDVVAAATSAPAGGPP
jgi:glycosyltransferase involved in cell wall biosynthesis